MLTTYWHRLGGGPLRAYHLRQVHQSFRAARSADGSQYPRGLLDRDQLEGGAARLLGPWFGEARSDPTRIGWGVVFETPADRALYVPEVRLRRSRRRPISPPTAPPSEQIWHTYRQVPIPGVDDVVAVLEATESWSHFATDVGRFTALRSGPLRGQTFEVEAIAELARHLPMLTRAYVTVTRVLDRSQADALRDRVAVLAANVARGGADEPEVLPAMGRPTHLIELTTHAGHFLGRGRNYLLLFESDDVLVADNGHPTAGARHACAGVIEQCHCARVQRCELRDIDDHTRLTPRECRRQRRRHARRRCAVKLARNMSRRMQRPSDRSLSSSWELTTASGA